MLSRIARGLYDLGQAVERAQNTARILEVNHKMNLERASVDEANVWTAVSEAFECGLDAPGEAALYGELVLSAQHSYSVKRCIGDAREQGRAMREHISEEMWLHLNRAHLGLAELSFEGILRIGRSEFNRQIEVFATALFGLADDTMIRGEARTFLRIGRLAERATMIGRTLEIKRKSLSSAPDAEGAPLDVHQWQALLRSLSGYEPYRRAYDARIVPARVMAFVLKREDFPRSMAFAVAGLQRAFSDVSDGTPIQMQLELDVGALLESLRRLDTEELVRGGSLEIELRRLQRGCAGIIETLDLGYFTSLRPASAPISAAPGSFLVPQ